MFTLTIDTDNDAFFGGKAQEVARILRRVADNVEFTAADPDGEGAVFTVRDFNGNRVGRAEFTND